MTGKSEWARPRFQNPLFMRQSHEIWEGTFDEFDGIVQDAFLPVECTRKEILSGFDILARILRVFVSNISFEENVLVRITPDGAASLESRVKVVQILG